MKKISLVLLLVAFTCMFSSAEAEKEPLWEYYSTSGISAVSISEDSRNISGIFGNKAYLWYNTTQTPHKTLGTSDYQNFLAASLDGKILVSGSESEGGKINLWEDGTNKWSKTTNDVTWVGLDVSSDGNNIAAISWHNVYFIQKSSSEEVWSDSYSGIVFSSVSISPNSQYIAAGTEDGNVYVYDTSSSDASWYHSGTLDGKITDLDFSGDSNYLIIGSENGKVYVYESEGDTPVLEWGQIDEVTCVTGSFNPDFFAFGTDQGLITVLNVATQLDQWEKNLGGIITEIDFNGDATYLVAGSTNKKLVLANVTNGDELWRISAFGDVLSVAMSYRGENIAVGTSAGLAIYYERQLDNQAPVANIESITPTTALPNTPVTMIGSAIDSDGSIEGYLWNSDIDGNLSIESNFTISNLSMGYHIISFSVKDNEGRWSKLVTMNIGIGDFPEASIDSITGCLSFSNCVINEGESIEFNGSAVSEASEDTEVVGYQWVSNFSGNETVISESASFTISSLDRGFHIIIFRAINDIGFWSSNVTANVLINGIPVLSSVDVNPNPVVAGDSVILFGDATDPDGHPLTYNWTTESLLFANGQNWYESSENGSSVLTTASNIGEYEVYLRVTDSLGVSSESITINLQVLSAPTVFAICDEDVVLNEEALFTAMASDNKADGGRIVLYEWDFNSSTGDIDSVDFKGAAFATYSYDYTPPDSSYLVVVRVTDNDGLVARDTCTVTIVADFTTNNEKSSSGNNSEFELPIHLIAGAGLLLVIVIGGAVFYMSRREDSVPYNPPVKSEPVSGSEYMKSVVPEVSPVKERRVRKRKVVTETMTIECPECSARMDIPKISGTQQIQCSECGLEGEIDL
jgi:WD40 repeat protein